MREGIEEDVRLSMCGGLSTRERSMVMSTYGRLYHEAGNNMSIPYVIRSERFRSKELCRRVSISLHSLRT